MVADVAQSQTEHEAPQEWWYEGESWNEGACVAEVATHAVAAVMKGKGGKDKFGKGGWKSSGRVSKGEWSKGKKGGKGKFGNSKGKGKGSMATKGCFICGGFHFARGCPSNPMRPSAASAGGGSPQFGRANLITLCTLKEARVNPHLSDSATGSLREG